GEELIGTVGFDPTGKMAGVYNGVFSVDLRMVATEGVFGGAGVHGISGVPFADNYTWNLTQIVTAQTLVSQDVEAGQSIGQAAIGIRNENTAVQLVDGFSSTQVSVEATFVPNPQTQAALLGSAIELNLSDIVDYYVMQITYLDADLPNGFDELDLRVHVYG